MRPLIFTLTLIIISGSIANAQVTEAEKKLRSDKKPEATGWTQGALISINTSQTSLTNWIAGGQNSISLNALLNAFVNYGSEKLAWENSLDMGYGMIKQGKKNFFKSDDQLELNSKVSLPFSEKFSAAGLVNFKTQLSPGYPSPEDLTLVSDLLSPAYLLGAIGVDGKLAKGWSVFAAPLTTKMTFVKNESLASVGSFGLNPGESFRAELGGYIRTEYIGDVMKNVRLQTKLDLFSNYLNGPQYVDVNWGVLLLMQVNKFLTASVTTQLIYDHDILIGKDSNGDDIQDDFKPRVQFKEIIGVGLTFKL